VSGPLREGQQVHQNGVPVRVKGTLKRRALRAPRIGGGYWRR